MTIAELNDTLFCIALCVALVGLVAWGLFAFARSLR